MRCLAVRSVSFMVLGLMLQLLPADSSSKVSAQEFKIDTQVYMAGDAEPISHNVTLFSGQMIYDILLSTDSPAKPVEVVIYDRRQRSFVLLDVARKIRMNLQQEILVKMVEGLRQETTQNKVTSFLVTDNYKENVDENSGWHELKNDQITYRFQGDRPGDGLVMAAYGEFLDQFTRLNASDPKKLPPFPRLRLNQMIKKYGLIPTKVEASLSKNELFKNEIKLSSRHTFLNEISEMDEKRIEEVKSLWMSFRQVEFAEFRGLIPASASVGKK